MFRVHDVEAAREAAERLLARGVRRVIVTLGGQGALAYDSEAALHFPAFPVAVVDTTAAGDAFRRGRGGDRRRRDDRADHPARQRRSRAHVHEAGRPGLLAQPLGGRALPPVATRGIVGIIREMDGVIGVKQSAGDMKLLADLLLLVGHDARIMTAVDALLYPSFALGAHGAIAAILTAVPRLSVQLWDAVQAGDHKQALAIHEKLLPIWNAIFDDNLPANVKCCREMQGRPAGVPRLPMPATSKEQEPIRAALQKAGVL